MARAMLWLARYCTALHIRLLLQRRSGCWILAALLFSLLLALRQPPARNETCIHSTEGAPKKAKRLALADTQDEVESQGFFQLGVVAAPDVLWGLSGERSANQSGAGIAVDDRDFTIPPFFSPVAVSTDATLCGKDVSARFELCPTTCPFSAEVEGSFCRFKCVHASQCGQLGTKPNQTIPDVTARICRQCKVSACDTCRLEAGKHLEKCAVCMPGYFLTKHGQCRMRGVWVFEVIGGIAVILVVVAITWYLRLHCRLRVNQVSADLALQEREKSLLQCPGARPHAPLLHPLGTNLLTTNVAGVGTMCFFRFQVAVIAWALVLMVLWVLLAIFVSLDLLVLGTKETATPAFLCAVVDWGKRRQVQLLWTKVAWLTIAWIFSFFGALVYAGCQAPLFAHVDASETSMSDFTAVLEGIPTMRGAERAEALLAEEVSKATGEEVVGVSLAWDYRKCQFQVQAAMEQDFGRNIIDEVCDEHGKRHTVIHHRNREHTLIWEGIDKMLSRQVLTTWNGGAVLTPREIAAVPHLHCPGKAELQRLLIDMESTGLAFVVFATEAGRDRAVALGPGIRIRGAPCSLSAEDHEPLEIIWENAPASNRERKRHIFLGVVMVAASCIAWTVCMYLPYAYYMTSFTYARGDVPGVISMSVFACVVCAAQTAVYVCSSSATRYAHFRYTSQHQRCYMVFYSVALILNFIAAIILQGFLSYRQMVGAGARTLDGQLLNEVRSFQELFESFPMQKSVGNTLFRYCWPATFLIPFVFEGLFAVVIPRSLGSLLIATEPRITGEAAIRVMEPLEMDQGRYADIIFNTALLAFIPFVTPGYMYATFVRFLLSHLVIYWYDSYKVLRCVMRFSFSTPGCHTLGLKLFGMPISVLAGALVFKANQWLNHRRGSGAGHFGHGFLQGPSLFATMFSIMALNLALYNIVLPMVIKRFSVRHDRRESTATYAEAAKDSEASVATYFNVNPIYSLRSKYIYKSDMLDTKPTRRSVPRRSSMYKTNPEVAQ